MQFFVPKVNLPGTATATALHTPKGTCMTRHAKTPAINSRQKDQAQIAPPLLGALSVGDQKCIIINILVSFAADADEFVEFCEHAGFNLRVIGKPENLMPAWLGHYRIKAGAYDVDRACNDLATWPPIAARIEELKREQNGV